MKFYMFLSVLAVCLISISGLTKETEINKSGVTFNHKYHVQEEEIDCQDCHSAVTTSQTGVDNLLPDMDVCSDCHDVEEEDNCGKCHSDTDDPGGYSKILNYSKKFPHKRHLDKDLKCIDCHSGISDKDFVLPYQLPVMNDCIVCHRERLVSGDCMTCHSESEDLRPDSHTKNFLHDHSDVAQNDFQQINGDNSCSNCHSENYCQDCHQGDNLDRMTHPLNFAFTHSLQAQGKEKECSSCHIEKQFCNDCHREYSIMPHSHKAGWTNTIPNDGGLHRFEAQNDLENCRSCHEQNAAQVCGNSGCHPKMN